MASGGRLGGCAAFGYPEALMAILPLGTLVALRYRLLWAQARTSAGRIALFFVLYVMGALLFAFLTLGGMGAALAAVRMGQGETILTGVLGGLFAAAIPTTLFLSVGPTSAFSERVLRHFPLTPGARFVVRHFIGLLDPLWLFFAATLLGLAVGLQLAGGCSIVVGLPAVLGYLVVMYLVVAIFVSLAGKVLETRVGPLVMMIAAMSVYLVVVFGAPLVAHRVDLARLGIAVLRFTPAASAGMVLAGANARVRLAAAALLLAWALAAALALRMVEPLRFARRRDAAVVATGESWYDALGDLFGPQVGPLFAKALRYHLRCNRIRYSLGFSAPVFVGILYVQHLSPGGRTFGLLMELFVIGFLATFGMSANYFGWDGPGVRRYLLVPVRAEAVVRAYSYVGILLGGMVACVIFGFGLATAALPPTLPVIAFAVSAAVAGLLWLHSGALWISVLAPKPANFDTMMSGNVSRAASLLMVVMVAPIFLVIELGMDRSLELVAYWWIVTLAAVVGAAVYWASLRAAGRMLEGRWERMAGDLAAKSGGAASAA